MRGRHRPIPSGISPSRGRRGCGSCGPASRNGRPSSTTSGTRGPSGLWVRGRPSLRMWALRSVAVVGARACTEYGAHMAATLAAGLAERGWVVVSGGAYGVDGAAHRGALGAGGATVAVLACGVDRPYPRGHTQLITRIAEQGLVVGELPPGDHPTQSRFVLRNRVIAALTRGTVVVEAAYRSGSLVTARAAQRLGRFTMGVPGPATSGLSAGVHELLRGEAVLVTDAAEVAELVGDMGELAPDRRGPVLPRDLLEPAAVRVLAALPARGTATVDDIGAGRVDDEGRRGRQAVRAPITWLRRTTRRRLEVDTPGDDLRPVRPGPVLTERVRPSGGCPTPLAIPAVGPLRWSHRATDMTPEGVKRNVSAYALSPRPRTLRRPSHATLTWIPAQTGSRTGNSTRRVIRHQTATDRRLTRPLLQAPPVHGRTAQGDVCPSTPPGPTGRRPHRQPATAVTCARPLPRRSTSCGVRTRPRATSGCASS